MPMYKLTYFNGRHRAELSRYILAYSGLHYKDTRLSPEEWMQLRDKTPLGMLPLLEVDEKMLNQSTTIARHLSRECGLGGKFNMDRSLADMIVDGVGDVNNQLDVVLSHRMQGNQEAERAVWTDLKQNFLVPWLDRYTKLLNSNPTGWFVGDYVTWADLAVAELLDRLESVYDPECLAGHPKLKGHCQKVHNIPNIKKYVQARQATPF